MGKHILRILISGENLVETTTEHISEEANRLEKVQRFLDQNINPYAYSFKPSHAIHSLNTDYSHLNPGDHDETPIVIAGRLMAKRGHGKAMFCNLLDQTGRIQAYINKTKTSDDQFDLFTQCDVGDIVGISGHMFKSQRGELTVFIESFELLTKSLLPLPEKYHGLQDKELRYRKRYVDLISNTEVRDVFKCRSEIIHGIRQYLHQESFMEVETPVLQSIYGGASARPFETYHNELQQNLYLRIALELHLKRLIVGGYERVFEIGRVFRNEGVSWKHNPEYTLLELYQAYADYHDIMSLTETLISTLIYNQFGSIL